MDLKQLVALVAVAEHGSFSAAARAIHTVQSNVSTHIARLEAEVGATLVDRATGRLTEEGDVAVARARRVQHELESLTADVAALHDQLTGTVRLGVIGSVGRWFVPPLLRSIGDAHPGIRVVVVDATTTSLVPQLVDDTLDLAIINLPLTEPALTSTPLFEEDRLLVVPADHPLADRDVVDLPELARHALVLEPTGTAFRDELDAAMPAGTQELTALAEVDGMMLVAYLASRGFGPAVLPASAIQAFGATPSWHVVPIAGLPSRAVGLAQRRSARLAAPARAVVAMIEHVTAEIGGHQAGIRLALSADEA